MDGFKEVIELQTAFQASNHPTLASKMKMCTDRLRGVVEGGSVSRGQEIGFIPAPSISSGLCHTLLESLDAEIRVRLLIMAGCSMNALFRDYQFLEDPGKRQLYREDRESIVV